MDVRFSAEQQALRDSVARVVERCGATAVGQLDDTERRSRLEAAVEESGWRELRADDGSGSPLATAVEVAIVAEQLGRGVADVSFGGPVLAAELRRRTGAPPATSPETVLMAPGLGGLARATPGEGRLTGAEVAIDAAGATRALLLIPTDEGDELATVELSDPDDTLDLTRPTRRPAAEAASMLEGQQRRLDAEDLTLWTALALSMSSADLVGTMDGAVQLARDYALQRRQYSAPIGSFQAVQHMLADGLVATEGSRSSTLYASWAVDALDSADALAAAAMAKAFSTRAALAVCEIAIQVHGGIGNTWECLAHVQLRRALLSGDIAGGVGPNLERVLAHSGVCSAGNGAALRGPGANGAAHAGVSGSEERHGLR